MKFAIHSFLLTALLATAVAAPDPGIPKAPLTVTLSLSGDMKSIQANVTNTGTESLDVIPLHTPLSTHDQGGYQVSDQNRVLTFTGVFKSYIRTNLSQFHMTIANGTTVTVLWSLSLVDFANSTGPYYVSTSGIFQYLPSKADADTEYLLGKYESNTLQFDNATPSNQTRIKDPVLVYTESCSEDELSVINAVGLNFADLADAGYYSLIGIPDDAFVAFFGQLVFATQDQIYPTVYDRFSQLQKVKIYVNTLNDLEQPIVFSFSCHDYDNGCTRGVAAYVGPPDYDVVTLCSLFFLSSRMVPFSDMCSTPSYLPSNPDIDFQVATILHELTHVKSVMNSQPLVDEKLSNGDKAYGYAAAKVLAIQDPSKAIQNPDNYVYFAEVQYARFQGEFCTNFQL